jgi:hypothetical protein
VPFIAGPGQPAADLAGKSLAELEAPLPYGFMADRNAAGGEDLINVAQAERKAEIEPDGEADDLSREAIAGVAGRGRRCHPVRLRDPACVGKPRCTQVDGAPTAAFQPPLDRLRLKAAANRRRVRFSAMSSAGGA